MAASGPEACRCVGEDPPDLVITDIQMPGMDGIALLKSIRERYPDLPVILMTGHETVETAVAALRNRAYDYFRKPVELQNLLDCIDRIGEEYVPPWKRDNGRHPEQ
jgi:DNA-binding NtrC family response regulator